MGLSLLLPGREVSTCQSFYYHWPSWVTPPWQAPLFPTATSSRIKQAMGTRVTSLLPPCLVTQGIPTVVFSNGGASSRMQNKCHLRGIHPSDMPMLGDRATQIQVHYFHTFRAESDRSQQKKHPQYLKKFQSQSFPHYLHF